MCSYVDSMEGTEIEEIVLWEVRMEFDLIYGGLKAGVRGEETPNF